MWIAYKRCQFNRDRPIMKGTLFQEQSTFKAVHWAPLEGFSWNSTWITQSELPSNSASLDAIVKRHFTSRTRYLLTISWLLFDGFSWTYTRRIAYERSHFGGDQPIMKDALLGEQVTTWQYLGFNSRCFPQSSQLAFYMHCLQMTSVWVQMVDKE